LLPFLSVPDGQTRVIYASFDDGLQIWVTDRNGLQSRWIVGNKLELNKLVDDFRSLCATPASKLEDVQKQSRILYSKFVQPITGHISDSGVLVVELDNSLANLPLEALQDEKGLFIGESRAIVYSPGLLREAKLRQLITFEFTQPVLFLYSPGATDYISGHESEEDAVRQLFSRSIILQSRRTSWDRFQKYLSFSAFFSFVGHTTMQDGKILLASDLIDKPTIGAEDFSSAVLRRLRLAVLAACSTGAGSEDQLFDTQGLIHAFIVAGVPAVFASRWNVDSITTALLMQSFYREITAGRAFSGAALAARRKVLVLKKHPYYWAAFSLAGRAG
jgi:CHAT domain-containing protein